MGENGIVILDKDIRFVWIVYSLYFNRWLIVHLGHISQKHSKAAIDDKEISGYNKLWLVLLFLNRDHALVYSHGSLYGIGNNSYK